MIYVREFTAYVLFWEFHAFRSLVQVFNHFEFLFVYGVRWCSSFILLLVSFQFSQHHLLRRLSFSTVYSWLLCCKLIDLYMHSFIFWALYSVLLIYVSLFFFFFFLPIPYCFNYCCFAIRECDHSWFVLLSQDCFSYFVLFCNF